MAEWPYYQPPILPEPSGTMKPIRTYCKQPSNKIISGLHVDMGRIKGLFCSFCLDQNPEQSTIEHAFNQSIDVSHLATPHVVSPSLVTNARSSPSVSESNNNNNEEGYLNFNRTDRNPTPQSHLISPPQPLNSQLENFASNGTSPDRASDQNASSQVPRPTSYNQPPQQQQNNYLHEHDQFNGSQQHSPNHRVPSQLNLYEHHSNSNNQQQANHRSNAASPNHEPLPAQRQHYNENNNNNHLENNQHHLVEPNLAHQVVQPNDTSGPTKLSYDIISVREPLAKILAEKQQLLQAQQLQRQLLGDHEYIEVYGERGSSCFYEEIAGSVTSSATYDQIGNSSNHNYQVLINAYAVAQRQNNSNTDNSHQLEPLASSSTQKANNEFQNNANSRDHNMGNEAIAGGACNNDDDADGDDENDNLYDVTSPRDSVDHRQGDKSRLQGNHQPLDETKAKQIDDERMTLATKSIPVYSVINKATRRSNSILRASIDNDDRPPRPPPKNSLMFQQHKALGAINHTYNEPTTAGGSPWSSLIPTTSSSYIVESGAAGELKEQQTGETPKQRQHHRLPQPPPRFSKQSAYNASDRPLPFPDGTGKQPNGNTNGMLAGDGHQSRDDCDNESLNNGYELLRSNLEDDQLDVGYEKIRESNRYSGGSLSSQLCQLQFLDNGGYESVQPIYSSPSNALVEPNYEAIAPATAAELAAAATARLTAAATVIEQIYNNSNR